MTDKDALRHALGTLEAVENHLADYVALVAEMCERDFMDGRSAVLLKSVRHQVKFLRTHLNGGKT